MCGPVTRRAAARGGGPACQAKGEGAAQAIGRRSPGPPAQARLETRCPILLVGLRLCRTEGFFRFCRASRSYRLRLFLAPRWSLERFNGCARIDGRTKGGRDRAIAIHLSFRRFRWHLTAPAVILQVLPETPARLHA